MNTQAFSTRLSTLPPSRREGLTEIFRRAQQRVLPTTSGWLNPEKSVGRYIGKDKWVHIWEATGPAREAFNSVAPRIKDYLDRAVEPISSRVTWSMYMVGRAPNIASPSIIFCCEVLGHRREVQNTIKESGILNSYPGIRTGHLPRQPGFDQLVPLGAGGQLLHDGGEIVGNMMALTSQGRSACGSQIFVEENGGKSVLLSAAATVGGVIRVGGSCYYTTAAHSLSPNSDLVAGDKGFPAEDGHDPDEDALSLDGSDDLWSPSDSNLIAGDVIPWHSPGGPKDPPDDNRYLKNEILRQWSLRRHHQAEEPLSSLANPEELSLNPTGRPFMTSADGGTQGVGLDYALIEMSSGHHLVENVINVGLSNRSTVRVHSVARSEPRDTDIIAVTPRGTTKGWISGTPLYSSTPGKRPYVRMFKATLDGPLRRGDCGTWVVDARNGELFGHIVLGSDGRGTALLIPFADIFDDIRSRLGISPTFPTTEHVDDIFRSAERTTRRNTTSSIRESPVSKGDDNIEKAISVSPIESESQIEGFSEVPKVKGRSEESTRKLLSEMKSEMKKLGVAERDVMKIISTRLARQVMGSQAGSDTKDWVGDISDEFGRLVAQKILNPSRELQKSREPSEIGLEGTSNFPMDPVRQRSSGTQSSRPPSDAALPDIPLETPAPPRDPKFRHVLFTFSNAPMRWENTELLDHALNEIDLKTIYSEAEEENQRFISQAQSNGEDTKPEWGYQDCVIRALSRYFGQSFFTRVRRPSCQACPSKLRTRSRGNVQPTPEEKAGRAGVVELYQCAEQDCQAYTRFPRYWDVRTLLRNPRGRAGESANCFGTLCRALGSRARWVWNAEDGIWTEVYSEHQGRWVHVDPCESAWDNPLLYTETMGKKMSYCIAFSSDGATDVTRRYVRSSRHALARTRCPETELLRTIQDIRSKRRRDMSKEDLARLDREDTAEAQELESYVVPSDSTDTVGH